MGVGRTRADGAQPPPRSAGAWFCDRVVAVDRNLVWAGPCLALLANRCNPSVEGDGEELWQWVTISAQQVAGGGPGRHVAVAVNWCGTVHSHAAQFANRPDRLQYREPARI